jgi:Pyruvate/2-oxoacid:ferredoxin oxidoreductase delta subunit
VQAGHNCRLHDIVEKPRPPGLGKVGLLGIACPTMYFRPTFAMAEFVARLPAPKRPTPTFLLATAGGEPGAHFFLLAEQLAPKGFVVLGAHWVIFPESWPPHRALAQRLAAGAGYGEDLCRRYPALRPWLSLAWPEVGVPNAGDRERVRRFVGQMLGKASGFIPEAAPAVRDLHRPLPGFDLLGRMVTLDMAGRFTAPRVVAERCSRCGACVKLCPARCISRQSREALPVFGPGCTGCWSCFQHCPERAIAGWKADPAAGQYPGPSQELREMFEPISAGPSGPPPAARRRRKGADQIPSSRC